MFRLVLFVFSFLILFLFFSIASAPNAVINDFSIENLPETRGSCSVCHLPQFIDEIRVRKIIKHGAFGRIGSKLYANYHLHCFAQERSKLGWFGSADQLPGFENLSPQQQRMAEENVPEIAGINDSSIFFFTLQLKRIMRF